MEVQQTSIRIQPLARIDKTRRRAEVIPLEEWRRDHYVGANDMVEAEELTQEEQAQVAAWNRQMDGVGIVGAILAGLCGAAVVFAQLAIHFNWQ